MVLQQTSGALARLFVIAAVPTALFGCSDLPSKGDALEVVKRDVKEEATCTLPIALLSSLKIQHTSKALCVPREGGRPADDAMACLDALASFGVTKPMPPDYMAQWPDDVSAAGFDSISPYERRARALTFKGCFELSPGLREGQFRCGEASAEKIVRVTKTDDAHATVRYSRTLKLNPRLEAIDSACGAVTRPGPENTVTFVKTEKKWAVEAPPAASSLAPAR